MKTLSAKYCRLQHGLRGERQERRALFRRLERVQEEHPQQSDGQQKAQRSGNGTGRGEQAVSTWPLQREESERLWHDSMNVATTRLAVEAGYSGRHS